MLRQKSTKKHSVIIELKTGLQFRLNHQCNLGDHHTNSQTVHSNHPPKIENDKEYSSPITHQTLEVAN